MSDERSLPDESRFAEISRRGFIRRTAALGIAVAVPSSLLAACSSDADSFEAGSTSTTAMPASTTSATSPGTASTSTTEAPTTTADVGSGSIPAGSELVVDFTYGADTSGSVKNPYVAVWVEDESGELVATIALWFLQSRKGTRWLSDLRRWATVDGSDETVDEISSSTRRPGEYSVVWDGIDVGGELIAPGAYYLAIESSRENGPYSLIREEIIIGSEEFTRALEPEGELSNATVSLVVT